MTKPLAIDLYSGLHGWGNVLAEEGFRVIAFDLYDMPRQFGLEHTRHPDVQLVLQDVRTLHGSQFKDAALIVGSSPCQRYSYMAMPWKRAKAQAAEIRADASGDKLRELNALFDAQFRIQREASEAAGRHIPMVVENVKGAQPWVGRAQWHFGSFYLWGDVPALMPIPAKARKFNPDRIDHHTKNSGGSWFAVAHNKQSGHSQNARDLAAAGIKAGDRNKARADGGHQWTTSWDTPPPGTKQHGSGPVWFDQGIASLPSASAKRKQASAMIAKIPHALAQHIARVYKPKE